MMQINLCKNNPIKADCPKIACNKFLLIVISIREVVKVGVLNFFQIKFTRYACNVLVALRVSKKIVIVLTTINAKVKGAKKITVPKIVMIKKPGLKIWPSIIYFKALLGAIVLSAILRVKSTGMRKIVLLLPKINIDNKKTKMIVVPIMRTTWEAG